VGGEIIRLPEFCSKRTKPDSRPNVKREALTPLRMMALSRSRGRGFSDACTPPIQHKAEQTRGHEREATALGNRYRALGDERRAVCRAKQVAAIVQKRGQDCGLKVEGDLRVGERNDTERMPTFAILFAYLVVKVNDIGTQIASNQDCSK
jgi:hypothetical protein